MLEKKIRRFITSGCYSDTLRYKESIKNRIKNDDEINLEGQWSYITELMIITIKSLIPSQEKVGTVIDYKRFHQELMLWYYYRHGHNRSVLNALKKKSSTIYWNEMDDSLYGRIFPIVAANSNWDVIKDQVLANIVYTTGNISCILEAIALSKLIFEVINGNISFDENLERVKEEIVHFSQKDFLDRFENMLMYNLDSYERNYTIDFERSRISLLNTLNNKGNDVNFDVIRTCLSVLDSELNVPVNTKNNFFLNGLKGLLRDEEEELDFKDMDFIKSLGDYLIKLRKSRISPEILAVEEYYTPDIFAFNEGEVFNHTLLNKSKVLKKEVTSDYQISYIKTKTGVYRFFKAK